VADPVHPLDRCLEEFQEQHPIVIVEIDVLLMVPSVIDVIDSSGKFESRFSWHLVLLVFIWKDLAKALPTRV
jgi:hypothetical protein